MSESVRPDAWGRRLIGLFCVAALGMVFAGSYFYKHENRAIRQASYDRLRAIAELKVRQITSWRQERLADARMNSEGILRSYVLQWLKTADNPSLRTAILAQMESLKEHEGYENVALAGTDGRLLLSLKPRSTDLEVNVKQSIAQAVSSRDVVLGDLFRCPVRQGIHLDVVAPILDDGGTPAAVLVLCMNAGDYLYPLVQSWPTPSRTSETQLIRRDGDAVLFLNELRHRLDPPLTLRVPLSRTDAPATMAALGKTGMFEGRDYRGVKVLADIRSVPGSPWFMVAKVDADEIFAEARFHGRVILLFVALSIIMTGIMGFLLFHRGQKYVYERLYHAERERREAQEEIRATLYSIGDGVIVTDVEGRIARMNPVAERLTGWNETEASGTPLDQVFRIVNEDTRTEVENPVQRVLREGLIVGLANHSVLVARNGTECPIADSGAPIRDEKGEITGVVLVFRDQTDERRTEEALKIRASELNTILQSIVDGILVIDSEGRVMHANARFGEMWRIPRDVIASGDDRVLLDFVLNQLVSPESFLSKVQQLYQVDRVDRDTLHFKDGRIFERFSSPLSEEGKIIGRVWVFRDVTAQRKMEDQLRQAQKMESVGRLAGGVAHDFNNMLEVIIGHVELALASTAQSSSLHENLREILKAAERSAGFARQLLAFARKQTVNPEVLDLNQMISGMLTMLRRLVGENIELIWKPGEGLWPIEMDPSQIDQIMANLALNARDAIPGVGSVTIETGNAELDENHCKVLPGCPPGEYVLLTVNDTGAGMDKATLEHIFEPFFTTKEIGRGTGLGLATVYGIVKQNNGFISVSSEPARGATFKIYLPRTWAQAKAPPAKVKKGISSGTETVLMVEDEEAILKLGKAILERFGYRVLAARTPGIALALAEKYEAPIHLLITDVVMPGMNGKELRKRLETVKPGFKCLYMSGYTVNVIAHYNVLEEGIHFLQKPFSVEALAGKVREVLDGT